jgi:hypothetical protein
MPLGLASTPNYGSHKFGLPSFLTLFPLFLFQVMIIKDLKSNIWQLSFIGQGVPGAASEVFA